MVDKEVLQKLKNSDYSNIHAHYAKYLILDIQRLNNPEYNKYLANYFISLNSHDLETFAGVITNEVILEMNAKDENFANILFVNRFNIGLINIQYENEDIYQAFDKIGLFTKEYNGKKYLQSKRDNQLINNFLIGNEQSSYKLATLVNKYSNINLILRLVPYFDQNQLEYFESTMIGFEKYLTQYNNDLNYQLNKIKEAKIDIVKLILKYTTFDEVLLTLSLHKNYEIAKEALYKLNKPE